MDYVEVNKHTGEREALKNPTDILRRIPNGVELEKALRKIRDTGEWEDAHRWIRIGLERDWVYCGR